MSARNHARMSLNEKSAIRIGVIFFYSLMLTLVGCIFYKALKTMSHMDAIIHTLPHLFYVVIWIALYVPIKHLIMMADHHIEEFHKGREAISTLKNIQALMKNGANDHEIITALMKDAG